MIIILLPQVEKLLADLLVGFIIKQKILPMILKCTWWRCWCCKKKTEEQKNASNNERKKKKGIKNNKNDKHDDVQEVIDEKNDEDNDISNFDQLKPLSMIKHFKVEKKY